MIRSGDHELFEAAIVKGRALADLAALAEYAEPLARIGAALGRAFAEQTRSMERAGRTLGRALAGVGSPPTSRATRSPAAGAPREPRPGRGVIRGAKPTAIVHDEASAALRAMTDELAAVAKLYPPSRTIDVSRRREPPRT